MVSVNDAYVMAYWFKQLGAIDDILPLADGNGEFTRCIGMEKDSSESGMGMRSKRYALLVVDRVVKYIGVDEGKVDKSAVQAILNQLS